MDGVHDLGGVNGFGRVEVEHDEPVFHESWEPIGYALAFGMIVRWRADRLIKYRALSHQEWATD